MHLATDSSSPDATTLWALPSDPIVIDTATLTVGFVVGLRSQHARRIASWCIPMTCWTWPPEKHWPGAAGDSEPGSSPTPGLGAFWVSPCTSNDRVGPLAAGAGFGPPTKEGPLTVVAVAMATGSAGSFAVGAEAVAAWARAAGGLGI
jgi:hypothetical protein